LFRFNFKVDSLGMKQKLW